MSTKASLRALRLREVLHVKKQALALRPLEPRELAARALECQVHSLRQVATRLEHAQWAKCFAKEQERQKAQQAQQKPEMQQEQK